MIRARLVEEPRLHPEHGPVLCLMVDGARGVVVWIAAGSAFGLPEGEASLGEWEGWPVAAEEAIR